MARFQIPIKVELMDTVAVIRYLIDEIEEEKRYNLEYKEEVNRAQKQAEKDGGYYWNYIDNRRFPRESRVSVIKENTKMIRRLCLKISKEELY